MEDDGIKLDGAAFNQLFIDKADDDKVTALPHLLIVAMIG